MFINFLRNPSVLKKIMIIKKILVPTSLSPLLPSPSTYPAVAPQIPAFLPDTYPQ